jgi:hypothetical protein
LRKSAIVLKSGLNDLDWIFLADVLVQALGK